MHGSILIYTLQFSQLNIKIHLIFIEVNALDLLPSCRCLTTALNDGSLNLTENFNEVSFKNDIESARYAKFCDLNSGSSCFVSIVLSIQSVIYRGL